MTSFIRTYAGRLAGVIAATVAAFLLGWGIDIDPDSIAGFEAFLEAIIVGGGLLAYGAVHQFIDGLLKGDKDEA